ncbi:MAG: SDR family oxidoreductase [Chloroflexi bacterium]|nr:SDR family oxidoreductase [Chloroflexota bacterium]
MVLDEFVLTGQTALVTGADSEAGAAIVAALAEAGADIVITARPGKSMERAAAAAKEQGRRVLTLDGDPTDADAVTSIVAQALAEFGKIDILVNNEQVQFAKPLLNISLDEWRRVLDRNLTSAFLFCQAVGRHMIERRQGKIINIASGMGDRGLPNSAAYSATQAGIIQLTSALSVEWGMFGVKVNAAGPVWFASEGEAAPADAKPDPVLRYIPMRRKGTWEELGRMVHFLACDGSHFLTGKTVFLDGGVLSHA